MSELTSTSFLQTFCKFFGLDLLEKLSELKEMDSGQDEHYDDKEHAKHSTLS